MVYEYKTDIIIISLKINLFSLWYSWKIAELALNNNHSLMLINEDLTVSLWWKTGKKVFFHKKSKWFNQSIIKLTLTSHHMHIKLIQPFYFCLMELKCFYINFLLNFFFIHNVPASRSCSKYLLLFLLSFNMHSKRLFSGKKNWINTKHATS